MDKLKYIISAWNSDADGHNQWAILGEDEKIDFAYHLFTTKHFGNQERGNMNHKYSIGSTVTFPGHEGQAEIMAVTYKKPYRYDLEYDNGKEIVYDVPEADIALVQAKVKK